MTELLRHRCRALGAWLRVKAPVLLAVALGLLVAGEALARVGGGQGYSGGSSGGGYSGGGSSGGSVDGDLVWFLVWLCIEYPVIGIPLVVGIAIVGFYYKVRDRRDGRYAAHHPGSSELLPPARRQHPRAALVQRRRLAVQALQRVDPDFSEPLFVDFVQLVYARAQALRAEPGHPWLVEAMTPGAMASLTRGGAVEAVEDVIFGSVSLTDARLQAQWVLVTVALETNLTEVKGGRRRELLCHEVWTFRRRAGVRSPGPERMRALGCPSCGSTLEVQTDGTCPNCGTVRTNGASQWQVHKIQGRTEPLPPPRPQLGGGGVEPGTHLPTVVDPDLVVAQRQLLARHPDLSLRAFEDRVRAVFIELQEAWSTQTWERARPLETDALFQVHRFWMDRYRRHGLVNKLAEVQVERVELCKVVRDAWLESITVRVRASMRDWMERLDGAGRPTGEVVGGAPGEVRTFSEYWTFVRTVGGAEPVGDGVVTCPSCGAPLDRVSQAGVCGYCDAKITTGDFDWVLSRIEQDEAYVG